MRIPSKKPQFFQPILRSFKNGIMIPQAFSKFLKGVKAEHAVLKRGCKKWAVKVNGRHFQDGWQKFVEENNVQIGDFVVFRHEGNMVFKVKVFDPSQCEREYVHRACDVGEVESVKAEEITWEKPSEILKFNRFDEISRSKQSVKLSAHPYFVTTLKPYNMQRHNLNIPTSFARANGLYKRKCEMIIKDQRQKSWAVRLIHSSNHAYISQGWREIKIANGLKEGDCLLFQLIHSGQKPVLKIYDLEGNQSTSLLRTERSFSTLDQGSNPKYSSPSANLEGKATCSTLSSGLEQEGKPQDKLVNAKGTLPSAGDHPFFVSTLKPYTTRLSFLLQYIPAEFGRSTGLNKRCCEGVIIDSRERPWSVELVAKAGRVTLRRGWSKFFAGNGLKEGDTFKLELIRKGDKPIMKFHVMGKRPSMTHLSGTTACSSSGNYPHFVSTIKAYSFKMRILYLPTVFARFNGLMRKGGKMMLRDDQQRLWSVVLRHCGAQFFIGSGWRDFCITNGLKEGDSYKFELIKKEKTPIANFTLVSGNSSGNVFPG